MKASLYVIFSALLLFIFTPALADKSDTAKSKFKRPISYSFTESMFAPDNIWAQNGWQNMHTTDTTLTNFETYITHYTLGNTGLPSVPVVFNQDLQPLGFYYGKNYVDNYFYNDSSIRYFDTRAPYTQFYYVSDPQIHQFFQFTHAQNFGKNLNIALGFKRIRSEGNYINQSTNLNQFTITLNYHTRDYLVFADLLYSVHKFQQNGGIEADSDLASKFYSDRQTVPVNLSYATTEIFEQSFHLQQYYFLGFKNADSNREHPLFYFSHSFKISGHSNVFTDNNTADSTFFNPLKVFHTALSPTLTYDSLRYIEINNDLSIGSGKGWNKFLRWEAGVRDQWLYYRNFVGEYRSLINPDEPTYMYNYSDTVYNNFIAHASLYNAFDSGKILFDASGQYIFNGSQQGDEQSVVQVGFKMDSIRFLKVSGSYSNQVPAYIYELYQGNNLYWMYHFQNTTTSSIALTYYDKKWKLGITLKASQMSNVVYFDTSALPRQYQPSFMVYSAGITKDFKLYKFHWNTSEKVQSVPNSAPLRFPQLVTENSIYFESYLFHHALLLRVGSDFYFNTSYYGYAYMPITDQYYLENSTKLGNYLYIDPFISFRIKTFRMFVKYENSTEGFVPYNYYYALHYPMPDGTLRFGISWDFWN